MAANVWGLAMDWKSIMSSLEPKLIEKQKMKIITKAQFIMPSWNCCWYWFVADCYSVSQPIAKPAVCVQRSCLGDESRSLDGRSGATFTIKPVVCCVALRSRVVNTFGKLSAGCATGASVRAERTVKRLWGLDNCYGCKKERCTWLIR